MCVCVCVCVCVCYEHCAIESNSSKYLNQHKISFCCQRLRVPLMVLIREEIQITF